MNEQMRRLRTGIFLAGGLLLVLVILFFLGGRDLLATKVKVRTYFSESVQGLSRGASVKYRGAPIGTVSKISILFSKRIVQVDMDIDLASFAGSNREFVPEFIREIRQGLRCRLEYLGITGLKFIDFDYFASPDSDLPAKPEFIGDPDAIYVPSVPSSFNDIYSSVAAAIEKLGRVNIEEIGENVSRALGEVTTLLSDPALKSAISRINEAAANLESSSSAVNRVLDEERLERLANLLEDGIKNIDALVRRIEQETLNARLPASAEAFRAASGAVVESRQEFGNTLLKLNQTLDSLRLLIDYLESDPSSLLNGKKRPVGER